MIISKDGDMDLQAVDTAVTLALEDKVHIDSEKQNLLNTIARQIHAHKERAGAAKNLPHEVHRWACILHYFCFVENKRNQSKEITVETIEYELFNTINELFPKDE